MAGTLTWVDVFQNEGTDCIDFWDGLAMFIQSALCFAPLFLLYIGKTEEYIENKQYILDISLAGIVFIIMLVFIILDNFKHDDNL